jgi:hypothetical protein
MKNNKNHDEIKITKFKTIENKKDRIVKVVGILSKGKKKIEIINEKQWEDECRTRLLIYRKSKQC